MNRTDKTATQIIADMHRLQTSLNLTRCRCCGKALDIFTQELHPKSTRQPSQYGTCRTVGCNRKDITREINELYALSQDVIDSFQAKSA